MSKSKNKLNSLEFCEGCPKRHVKDKIEKALQSDNLLSRKSGKLALDYAVEGKCNGVIEPTGHPYEGMDASGPRTTLCGMPHISEADQILIQTHATSR